MEHNHLDKTDIGILNLLQKDGLLTYKEIAHKLSKTITPIVERIKRLKKEGYIKDIVAMVDFERVKHVFIAFPHVQLNDHSRESLRQFQREMERHPEVMECYHLTGQFDFMLKVIVSDMHSYNAFIVNNVGSLSCVGNIESFLVLSTIKHQTAYTIES